MANFDNKNDKIKERGTELQCTNPNGQRQAAYDDGLTSSFSSRKLNRRKAGFLRTSQCLFNPSSSRMARNEPGSRIEDYESSNMNAVSTRLRSESPFQNGEMNQYFDQFNDIEILEPLGQTTKPQVSPRKKDDHSLQIDDLQFNNAQRTPRALKTDEIYNECELQRERKQKLSKCENLPSNPGKKIRKKLIHQLQTDNDQEQKFRPMYNNLMGQEPHSNKYNNVEESKKNFMSTQNINPQMDYHDFLANQPTRPAEREQQTKEKKIVIIKKQSTDTKGKTLNLAHVLGKINNEQQQLTLPLAPAAIDPIVQSCTGGSQMVNFSNTSAASTTKNKRNQQKLRGLGLKLDDGNFDKLALTLGVGKKATKTPKAGSQGIPQGLFAFNVDNRTKHKPTGSLVGVNDNNKMRKHKISLDQTLEIEKGKLSLVSADTNLQGSTNSN